MAACDDGFRGASGSDAAGGDECVHVWAVGPGESARQRRVWSKSEEGARELAGGEWMELSHDLAAATPSHDPVSAKLLARLDFVSATS